MPDEKDKKAKSAEEEPESVTSPASDAFVPKQPGETREPFLTEEQKQEAEDKAEEDAGKVQTSPAHPDAIAAAAAAEKEKASAKK